jgi:biopolymer transport protein ExbD
MRGLDDPNSYEFGFKGKGMQLPRREHSPFTINMTPMIDVVFQLLIFFVCTVEFQRAEDELEANLPPQEGAGIAPKSPEELDLGRIDIAISREAVTIRFQGRTKAFAKPDSDSAWTALRQQLEAWRRIDAKIPVHISCQPDVPTGLPLRVYDLCVQAGFTDVGLLNKP